MIGSGKSLGMDVVQVRQWESYDWLRHGFSTRAGGLSTVYAGGQIGELNLGWTKEDDPALVAENRRLMVESVGRGSMLALVTIRQVHSATVQAVKDSSDALVGQLQTFDGKAILEGDGLITGAKGVLLGIQTADCVPVIVVDVKKRVVGVFHAGWRGTVARIAEYGIAAMGTEYGSQVEDLVAAVGPSIGACCYTVGDEVRREFEAAFGYAADLFQVAGGEMRLDLWEANRRQLVAAGVPSERIAVVGECSGCAVDATGRRRYFSHRVEKGFAGRMLSVVGVV